MQNSFPLISSMEAPVAISRRHPILAQVAAWVSSPAAMVVVALALRLAMAAADQSYKISPNLDHFDFGYETGRVARSLAEGAGFSSPFQGHTGPTAWLAPLFPVLVAGVFKIFGVYTQASAWTLLALNSLFSALTCWVIYAIAKDTVGSGVARWAGWTWALLPHAMWWASRWIWETSLSTLLLALALLLALRLERDARLRTWAAFGLMWGLIALTNPSCLSLLPFLGMWIAYRLSRQRRAWFAGAAASAVIFLAMVLPWTFRNYEVFHRVVPVRDNFGVEFWLGNGDYSEGLWNLWLHPSTNELEMAKYNQMGEINYVRSKQQETMEFVRRHPARFLELCVHRAGWFWVGIPRPSDKPLLAETRNSSVVLFSLLGWWGAIMMIRRRRRGAWLVAFCLAVYPAVYYLTFVDPRYRHPIEPEMMIAGFYLLSLAMPRRLSLVRRSEQAAAPASERIAA
jgi:4-amino-4-deoxy-L-arabinose transferase-like glycosyltransferase